MTKPFCKFDLIDLYGTYVKGADIIIMVTCIHRGHNAIGLLLSVGLFHWVGTRHEDLLTLTYQLFFIFFYLGQLCLLLRYREEIFMIDR